MVYNLQNEREVTAFKDKVTYLISKGKTIDLIEKKNTRTSKQNSALHLLFTIMTNQLNEMGMEFQYFGLRGQQLSMRYTPELCKNQIWKPIQKSLFDIESTTKINTDQINEIVDVLCKFFGERGVVIQFPSKKVLDSLINN